MNRVLLVNTKRVPSREEITYVDRVVGESFFSGLDLQYAGYITSEGDCRLAANWIVPDCKIQNVIDHLRSATCPKDYEARMFVQVKSGMSTLSQRIS